MGRVQSWTQPCAVAGRSPLTRCGSATGTERGHLTALWYAPRTASGVTGPVMAELHKLLLYGQGCFFVGHRDTEKASGTAAHADTVAKDGRA